MMVPHRIPAFAHRVRSSRARRFRRLVRVCSRLNLGGFGKEDGGGGGGGGDWEVGALGFSMVVGLGQQASPPFSSFCCLESIGAVVSGGGVHEFELTLMLLLERASINRSHRLSLSKQSSYDTPKPTNSDLISDTLIFDGCSTSVLATVDADDSLGAQVSFSFDAVDDDDDASSLWSILEQLSYLSSSEEEEEDMRVPVPSLRMKRMVSFHTYDDDEDDRLEKMFRCLLVCGTTRDNDEVDNTGSGSTGENAKHSANSK